MEIFVKFSSQFFEEPTKNCTETTNNFREKLQRNPKVILEIFGALLKTNSIISNVTRYRKCIPIAILKPELANELSATMEQKKIIMFSFPYRFAVKLV